ncbi:hypothetical protein AC1031_015019 [Aphanomyces cochlioides]|nr:hypothetical protein AC1031_015019 [Aphanomyces cochlioides]
MHRSPFALSSAVVRCMTHSAIFLVFLSLYVVYEASTTTVVWSSSAGIDVHLSRSSTKRYRDVDGDLIHLSRLNAACLRRVDGGITWSYNSSTVDDTLLLTPTTNENVLRQLLAQCPDVDIFFDIHDRDQCEDAMAYVKYLNGRALPRWIFERTFTYHGQPWRYMDLCPNTALLFMTPRAWATEFPFNIPSEKTLLVVASDNDAPRDWQFERINYLVTTTNAMYHHAHDWYSRHGNPRGAAIVHMSERISSDLTLHNPSTRNFINMTIFHANMNRSDAGTSAIMDCWQSRPDLPPLRVYDGLHLVENAQNRSNLQYFTALNPEDLGSMLAETSVVLWPSSTESGHALNQARASGALVATTNGSPMNQLVDNGSGVLIEASEEKPSSLPLLGEWLRGWPILWTHGGSGAAAAPPVYQVTADAICRAMDAIVAMSPIERERRARAGQALYIKALKAFKQAMFSLRMRLMHDFDDHRRKV